MRNRGGHYFGATTFLPPPLPVHLHINEQLASATFGVQTNFGCLVLQRVIPGLPRISDQSGGFVVDVFYLIDAKGRGKCFAAGIVPNQCDRHTLDCAATWGRWQVTEEERQWIFVAGKRRGWKHTGTFQMELSRKSKTRNTAGPAYAK